MTMLSLLKQLSQNTILILQNNIKFKIIFKDKLLCYNSENSIEHKGYFYICRLTH